LLPQRLQDFGGDRFPTHLRPLSVLHGGDQSRQPKSAACFASPIPGLPFWPHRLPRSLVADRKVTPRPLACSRLYPRKNPGRCDLLHISLVGPGLDRRYEQRDQNLIRRAGRPPHRLRPDRYRRRGGPGCTGLPPAGLNRAESAQRASIRARLDTSARQPIRFISSGVFRGAVATASGPDRFHENPSSVARTAAANHPPF
jgi:hypothetical protein